MSFSQDQIKAELIRRLEAGEITREQAKAAADKFRASQEAPPVQEQAAPQMPQQPTVETVNQGAIDPATPTLEQAQQAQFTDVNAPAPVPQNPMDKMGFWEGLKEQFTGEARSTPEMEAVEQWDYMPEVNSLESIVDPAAWKAVVGSFFADQNERAKIIKANFPDLETRQDEKGNWFFKSKNGKWYGDKSGFRVSDIPNLVGTAALGAATATTGGLLPAALMAAGTEAGIEATQAATGGDFNAENVALAGALGPAGELVGQAAGAGKRAIGGAISDMVTPQGASQAMQQAGIDSLDPQAPSLIKRIQTMMGEGDEAGLEQAARETPEAFMTAQKKGAIFKDAAEDAPISDKTMGETGELVRKASKGNKAAQIKLSEGMNLNAKDKADAEAMGFDVPLDVYSDSQQHKAAAGLSRSQAGEAPEAQWQRSVMDAADKADEILQEHDAIFLGEGPSMDVASTKIRTRLTDQQKNMDDTASRLYKEVDGFMPKTSQVQMVNLSDTLDEVVTEVGEASLSAPEKRLMKMIESDNGVTYGGLMREKNLIGKAIRGGESPYSSMDDGALKRLYGALAQDQLDNVEAVGGEKALQKLKAANLITGKKKKLEKRITHAFGEDVEGSIAGKLSSMLTSATGKQGDATQVTKMIKTVPKELRGEVLMTAMANNTRAKSGLVKGGFGFNEYADFYRGLRKNPTVYKEFEAALPKETLQTMQKLYAFSKRMTAARANVLQTGKANQSLANAMQADGLVSSVMNSTAGKMGATLATGMTAGPLAAAAVPAFTGMFKKGGKDAIIAAGDLFNSDQFQELASKSLKKKIAQEDAAKLAKSPAFLKFSKKANIKNPTQWIMGAMRTKKDENE